jgi:hypothetical protein
MLIQLRRRFVRNIKATARNVPPLVSHLAEDNGYEVLHVSTVNVGTSPTVHTPVPDGTPSTVTVGYWDQNGDERTIGEIPFLSTYAPIPGDWALCVRLGSQLVAVAPVAYDSGGEGGYASLTGAGETAYPGALTQHGGFTVDDTQTGNGISFTTEAGINLGTTASGAIDTHTGDGGMIAIQSNPNGSLAFFDVSGVTQQTPSGITAGHTPGSGAAVTEDSTFTGDDRPDAYTVGDVVAALKAYGLLSAGPELNG